MADQFDEFLQEVQQDIQQEKYLKLWKKYGRHATTGVIVLLAAATSYVVWNNYQAKRKENVSDGMFTAQNYANQDKNQEALAVLESLSVSDKEAYGYMRNLQKAAYLLKMAVTEKDGDTAKKHQNDALSLYEFVGKNMSLPLHIREYSTFIWARTLWDLKQKSSKEIFDALSPLMEDKKPWRCFAQELAGMIHYQENRFKEALELFVAIVKSEGAPEGLRMRARMMSQLAKQKVSLKINFSDNM